MYIVVFDPNQKSHRPFTVADRLDANFFQPANTGISTTEAIWPSDAEAKLRPVVYDESTLAQRPLNPNEFIGVDFDNILWAPHCFYSADLDASKASDGQYSLSLDLESTYAKRLRTASVVSISSVPGYYLMEKHIATAEEGGGGGWVFNQIEPTASKTLDNKLVLKWPKNATGRLTENTRGFYKIVLSDKGSTITIAVFVKPIPAPVN